ncbi:hypothetical protein Slin15195_G130570 [Septoria linicola]|uniref:Uncharacterized protein n=1 Tax=Septoria linicola TaxID=215465 RepID=A0A9Q9B685_9PEZI|nr:hypothetical protein Slin15195_G130570 [Septoria linicola]
MCLVLDVLFDRGVELAFVCVQKVIGYIARSIKYDQLYTKDAATISWSKALYRAAGKPIFNVDDGKYKDRHAENRRDFITTARSRRSADKTIKDTKEYLITNALVTSKNKNCKASVKTKAKGRSPSKTLLSDFGSVVATSKKSDVHYPISSNNTSS